MVAIACRKLPRKLGAGRLSPRVHERHHCRSGLAEALEGGGERGLRLGRRGPTG